MNKKRRDFFEKTHRDYVVIFLEGNKSRVSFGDEGMRSIQGVMGWCEEEHVDYLVVDNLEVVRKKTFEDNKYKIWKKRWVVAKTLEKIYELLSNNRGCLSWQERE